MISHLFVPGLLGPMQGLEHSQPPALPNLEALLARADRLDEPEGYAGGLFALFGIDTPTGSDLPTAAVSFLADTGDAPAGFVLHADALHLMPDRDHLLAFGLDDDPLDADEVSQLLETFNAHFAEDGVRLEGTAAGSLYLHCDSTPSIQTHPLSALIGRNIDRFLPEGDDRRRWHGLLNETQMLCYSLDFNRQREATGRPMVGGLWFSGGGVLPTLGRDQNRFAVARLVGDCSVARGLVALGAAQSGAVPVVGDLVVEHALCRAVTQAAPDAWLRALAELEGRMTALLRGGGELHVHPGNAVVYRWTARTARRWWRRKRPFIRCLDARAGRAGMPGGKPA